MTRPSSLGNSPARHSRTVVFPAPLGPISPSTSPVPALKLTSDNTRRAPNVLLIPSTLNTCAFCAFLWLKLVAVAQRHTAARAVDSPTDAAIRLVKDVFKVNKQLRSLRKFDRATKTNQSITRKMRKQWYKRVVVDDAHTIDRSANRKQTILHLGQCLASRNQDTSGRTAARWSRSRQAANTRAATKEVL